MKTIYDIKDEIKNMQLMYEFNKEKREIYLPNLSNCILQIAETDNVDMFQFTWKKMRISGTDNYKSIFERIDEYIQIKTRKKTKVAGEAPTDTQEKIAALLDSMKDLLLYKNQKYGDSAINPKKIFYKGDSTNSILIRLDDKLGRVMSNTEEKPRINDVADIIGYCTLLMISMGVTPDDIAKFKD